MPRPSQPVAATCQGGTACRPARAATAAPTHGAAAAPLPARNRVQELLAEGKIMKLMMEVDKFNRPFADEVLRTAAAAGEAAGADGEFTGALAKKVSMWVAE